MFIIRDYFTINVTTLQITGFVVRLPPSGLLRCSFKVSAYADSVRQLVAL
jgi:hypothetical protein